MTGYKHTFLLLFWGLKPELQAWYTSYSTTELQSKHIFILRQAFQLGPFSKPHKSRIFGITITTRHLEEILEKATGVIMGFGS